MPFVNTAPRAFNNPCLSVDTNGIGQCVEPYGYQHHMTLTDNSTLFESEVKSAKVSGNLDSPEGGLDALMQVIVCEKEIGWRQASRKLIVFSTDAGFHYAGDGKLVGIVEPNDGICHLDSSSKLYTHSLLQDTDRPNKPQNIAKKTAYRYCLNQVVILNLSNGSVLPSRPPHLSAQRDRELFLNCKGCSRLLKKF